MSGKEGNNLQINVIKCYCQNPNLIITQPQPNLNPVGFDMLITVHYPPQELYFYQKE